MLTDLFVIISSAPAIVSLNGMFTTLKNSITLTKDSVLPIKNPQHRTGNPLKELPDLDMTTARATCAHILAILTAPSWEGVLSLLAIIAVGLISAFIVMFIDLPLAAMIALSLVALAAAGLSVTTIKRRSDLGAWLPSGIPGKKGDTNPVPSQIPDFPATQEFTDPLHASDIPGDASLATLERYWVVKPYSYVKIERLRNEGFTYIVVEPAISQKEKTILMETYAHLRDIIIYDNTEKSKNERIDPVAVARIIRQFDPDITDDRVEILKYYIERDLSGYGQLEVLMRDPALEDLSCNGHDLPVFIFHRTYGSLPTSIFFTEAELNQFVLKLAQKANKQMSLSNPMVDATLPNGARIQITYSAVVSTKGSSFTIRKFRAEPMTPLDLIRYGTYNAQTLAFLWLAIEHRKSLLVVGGTASGKTSMMNAVSLFIPQNAKVVSLEDTREIQLPHKNWLPTQTRELNVEGIKGDIDLFSLLRACMRQRPEYIIVGEVRGVEAQTLFQAMNSGHATLSTIHAGSVHEAINRLTHDPINVPAVMFQALDLVVVQSIYTLGKTRIRRCLSIHEIEVTKHGEINAIPMFEWDIQNDTFRRISHKSKVLNEIAFHCGWDEKELEHQLKKREEFFSWALEVEPPTIRDLANAIHDLGD
ncbi:MAG: type II/IV secretion system ATPase subunit [Methanoregula sp.]|nr:type II/IV secretion system ATPase subunit [Methanoregula sp.]